MRRHGKFAAADDIMGKTNLTCRVVPLVKGPCVQQQLRIALQAQDNAGRSIVPMHGLV